MNRQANSANRFSPSFFFFFLSPPLCSNTQTHKQTQIPAAPVMPVTFLISSELLSMPAVKRFSVSYARHPTNGMSAFFFDTPPVLLLSCMTVLWENIFYVFCFGRCDVWLHYLHHLRFLVWFFLFLFQRTPSVFGFCFVFYLCCQPFTSNITCSACKCFHLQSCCSQDG